MTEWKEVNTQEDIDELLDEYGGFHDSCIASITYQSGTNVDDEKCMHYGNAQTYTLCMTFNSQWAQPIELCFSGLRRLNLVGLQDNYFDDFYGASIFFCNDLLPCQYQAAKRTVVWIGEDYQTLDKTALETKLKEPAETYVIAQSLKWRFIEPNKETTK